VSISTCSTCSSAFPAQTRTGPGLAREGCYTFDPGFKLTERNIAYQADLNTHSVVIGISLRF
jgi:hypothetical protein